MVDPDTLSAVVTQGVNLKWFYVRLAAIFPLAGMLVLWLGLRFVDWTSGIKFSDVTSIASADTLLRYAGMRWLGACAVLSSALIMLGMVLSS